MGAGSRIFKSNKRQVSKIATHVGASPSEVKLLFRLANYLKPNSLLELGTSLGLGTQPLALGASESRITTVEGCPNTAAKALKAFKSFGLENIEIKTLSFESYLEENSAVFDLVYIDGNHAKTPLLAYFNQLKSHTNNDSCIIIDDLYWSPEMKEAWNEIVEDTDVTVSIDLFKMGLVFFRKEQKKQHFQIRM